MKIATVTGPSGKETCYGILRDIIEKDGAVVGIPTVVAVRSMVVVNTPILNASPMEIKDVVYDAGELLIFTLTSVNGNYGDEEVHITYTTANTTRTRVGKVKKSVALEL